MNRQNNCQDECRTCNINHFGFGSPSCRSRPNICGCSLQAKQPRNLWQKSSRTCLGHSSRLWHPPVSRFDSDLARGPLSLHHGLGHSHNRCSEWVCPLTDRHIRLPQTSHHSRGTQFLEPGRCGCWCRAGAWIRARQTGETVTVRRMKTIHRFTLSNSTHKPSPSKNGAATMKMTPMMGFTSD